MNQLATTASLIKPDPKIEQSLAKTTEYLSQYKPLTPEPPKDVYQAQFKIELTQPLPKFDYGTLKAYQAQDMTDGRSLYGVVCENTSILRHKVIERMLGVRHPDLVSVVAAGPVSLSQPDEERFVVFFEQPKGQRLSTMLANAKGKIPATIIIEHIIHPIIQASLALADAGITHGSINPDNIYYETHAVLGPCVLEPCGYSQPFYYELVERMQAHPAGKGEFNAGTDFYAVAVMVLEILLGARHFEHFTPDKLSRLILRKGNFDALTGNREPPEEFYDFISGMLGSGHNTRWNYRYLKPWLEGKHYNVPPITPPTEGVRPYEIFDTTGHSRREVAHLMRHNWNGVAEALNKNSLSQWTLMVLRLKDFSEAISRLIRTIVESGVKNEKLRNETLLRLILLLDQEGPLQYQQIALHVDGLESFFAHAFINQNNTELTLLTAFIEQNLGNIWLELQRMKEVEITDATIAMLNKFERVRALLRNTGLGFGIERAFYELNPNMPCLSPLCRGRHITNLTGLLKHLDKIAPNLAANQDPIDNHLAAFMTSKLGIQSEIKLHDLSAVPQIATNRTLIALKLFAVAQHRSGNIELSGLTHWIAQRVLPSMQYLQSQTIRGRTLQMVLDEAMDGRTQRLGDVLLDGEIVNADFNGFQKALKNYKNNALRIEHYKRATNLDRDSAQMGAIIAKIFAYMVFLVSIYKVFAAGI